MKPGDLVEIWHQPFARKNLTFRPLGLILGIYSELNSLEDEQVGGSDVALWEVLVDNSTWVFDEDSLFKILKED